MKISTYLSYAFSLIFIVMGILFLTGILFKSASDQYSSTRITFGIVLLVYGLFRGIKAYLVSKKKNTDETDNII